MLAKRMRCLRAVASLTLAVSPLTVGEQLGMS